MNGRELLEAMSFIDDALLQQAREPSRRRIPWGRWGAVAACACLVLLSVFAFRVIQPKGATEGAADDRFMLAMGAADSAAPESAEDSGLETAAVSESRREPGTTPNEKDVPDNYAGSPLPDTPQEGRILVLELTQEGFIAQVLQLEDCELAGSVVLVLQEDPGTVPEAGKEYTVLVTRVEPDNATIWICALEPGGEE